MVAGKMPVEADGGTTAGVGASRLPPAHALSRIGRSRRALRIGRLRREVHGSAKHIGEYGGGSNDGVGVNVEVEVAGDFGTNDDGCGG